MKGAKIAFKIPIKINRRLSLYTRVSWETIKRPLCSYPSINAARFLLFKKTFLT